jgi:hypothetical protein
MYSVGKSANDCAVFMADGLHSCYKRKYFMFCFAWHNSHMCSVFVNIGLVEECVWGCRLIFKSFCVPLSTANELTFCFMRNSLIPFSIP